MWLASPIQWLLVQDIILCNLSRTHPISWKALEANPRFCWEIKKFPLGTAASALPKSFQPVGLPYRLQTCLASPNNCVRRFLSVNLWINREILMVILSGRTLTDTYGRRLIMWCLQYVRLSSMHLFHKMRISCTSIEIHVCYNIQVMFSGTYQAFLHFGKAPELNHALDWARPSLSPWMQTY